MRQWLHKRLEVTHNWKEKYISKHFVFLYLFPATNGREAMCPQL